MRIHHASHIALAIQHQAFPAGQEAQEIRALWQTARQKVLLDEQWLMNLLAPRPVEETSSQADTVVTPVGGPRVDWGATRLLSEPSMGVSGNSTS